MRLVSCLVVVIILGIPEMSKLNARGLVINEFLASNSSVNRDPDFGLYSDWIELYNPSNDTAFLDGFFLSDNRNDLAKWPFPEKSILPPGAYLLIWADGKDTLMQALHSNFKLSRDGEEIILLDTGMQVLDSLAYEMQETDISTGRQPDGESSWHQFGHPTPGYENASEVFLKTQKPQLSLPGGFYVDEQVLEIMSEDEHAEIRFTTNGDDPDRNSLLYTGPIQLKSRAGEANVYSEIRTNKDPFLWLPDWGPPRGEVFKANVIRARAFREGFEPSDIACQSYFIDPGINHRYSTIALISIVTDSRNLFDRHEGIYVPGYLHKEGQSGTGNYFEDWEKAAHLEFFEPGGEPGFSQDIGISIQGGSSPASPQKGLHVFARSKYGENRISYPLFRTDPSRAGEREEFKRFIIRAWGSLITGALFNDAYAQRLMAGNDLDIQAYRPVILFLNGEYWGIHALREANKNSWYYQYHYGIDRDDPGFDILLHQKRNGIPHAYVDEGDDLHWRGMMDFIQSHDMTDAGNYQILKGMMDVDNFIAYMGHCIYLGKWDWPNNNDSSWRPRTADGKWRWIQFDMETGFGVATGLGPEYKDLGPEINMFEAAIRGLHIPNFGTYGPHPIFSRIYQNEEFRDAFVNWFAERFEQEFHPEEMNRMLDEMATEIRPYMDEYIHRWPFIGRERGSWEASVEDIRNFNLQRQNHVREQLLQLYHTDKITPPETKLLQNFPNPFQTKTSIYYHLLEAGDVIIRIFNGLGQEVAAYQRQHGAGGQYSISIDARELGSGIHFYSMESGSYYEVMKMMVQ